MKINYLVCLGLLIVATTKSFAQDAEPEVLTHADTLRGSINPQRSWWDVQHYAVTVTPDFDSKTIQGKTAIRYKVTSDNHPAQMQIDLQQPLEVDSVFYNGALLSLQTDLQRNGNLFLLTVPATTKGSVQTVTVVYHGKPREATNPPWDGGWIWKRDSLDRPWMSVACQGLGASVWYPCKDHQSDEPDSGATLKMIVPSSQQAVGNGRLVHTGQQGAKTAYTWQVTNPINNYNLIPDIGSYTHFGEQYNGLKGPLSCDYWVLDYNLEKAKRQFQQASQMLKAFEYWFGPYPFYEDGYKLVESPHLGMEHQSAVAYGNHFLNGYLGRDLSGTGWGLKWDYIIVHESGHEWFANNITTADIADMWVHEGFTMYSEVLFTEYYYGKQAADVYDQGVRRSIQNKTPVIGPYGVNKEGSGDMYPKGANLLHTVRQVINNDSLFRSILQGLNKTFYHQIVTSKQVEAYFSEQSHLNLQPIFDQYLRTIKIPVLELQTKGKQLRFRWQNTVAGFAMPVRLTNGQWLKPTNNWQTAPLANAAPASLSVDPNFYITVKRS